MTLRPFSSLNLTHIRSMSPQSALPTVPIASAFSISPRFCGFLTAASMRCSRLSLIVRLFEVITGQAGIDFAAPGVDPATQALHILKTLPVKIRCRIQAARPLVVVNHEQICPRPLSKNFLHRFLGEKMCAWELNGVEFF